MTRPLFTTHYPERPGLTANSQRTRWYGLSRLEDRAGDDAELCGDVLAALMLDTLIPMTADAKVRGGYVTLIGTADWRYQRAEAEFLDSSVPGVLGIRNDISLTAAPDGGDTGVGIASAFRRCALLTAVNSWAEHYEAVRLAWSAPRVTAVDDQ